jgi:hypothetical protein
MNYSMHDPLNASGNVAGVCTWTADGAEVFLGGHQGQILFAINKRTTYTLGESADTAADWTVMQAVLQPRLGESLYRPKTAKLPDWLTPLAVIGGAALLKQLLCGDADLKTCAEPFR